MRDFAPHRTSRLKWHGVGFCPQAQRIVILRQGNLEQKKALAKRSPDPLLRGPPSFGMTQINNAVSLLGLTSRRDRTGAGLMNDQIVFREK